jgi:hypothetical protein
MKNKWFNLITVSFATSLLLAPAQKAHTLPVEPQANIKETQPLVHSRESQCANSEGSQNQAVVEDKALNSKSSHSTHAVAGTSKTTDSSQPPSSAQENFVQSNTVGGVFVTFLFLGYILGGLQYRRYRTRRAATLLQQIETLERIWRMKPQQR